ncbi:MAG: hypothetical protein H6937_02325 [Burkholderiales bacterium]|nr:hypothetical protein [Burkholderiales bacterium]
MQVKAAATDELILTSLRPMSELCQSVPVMLFDANFIMTLGIFFSNDKIVTDNGIFHCDDFIGWRDLPKFRPGWMDS